MKNFSKLLQDIKDNPVVYLGQPSITCLHSFLNSYLSTLSDLRFTREGSVMDGFREWVQVREKATVPRSWEAILLYTTGSERTTFYRFFELFDEFRKHNESLKSEVGENSQPNVGSWKPGAYNPYQLLLSQIKKRPGMYLGTASITRLDMMFRGYTLARREVGIPPTEQEREFEGFQPWIQEKYGIKSGQSWAKIILFFSVDEPEALERFFELYEEYQNWNRGAFA